MGPAHCDCNRVLSPNVSTSTWVSSCILLSKSHQKIIQTSGLTIGLKFGGGGKASWGAQMFSGGIFPVAPPQLPHCFKLILFYHGGRRLPCSMAIQVYWYFLLQNTCCWTFVNNFQNHAILSANFRMQASGEILKLHIQGSFGGAQCFLKGATKIHVLVNQKMPISTVQYVLFYIAGGEHWFHRTCTCSYATKTVALGLQEELFNWFSQHGALEKTLS